MPVKDLQLTKLPFCHSMQHSRRLSPLCLPLAARQEEVVPRHTVQNHLIPSPMFFLPLQMGRIIRTPNSHQLLAGFNLPRLPRTHPLPSQSVFNLLSTPHFCSHLLQTDKKKHSSSSTLCDRLSPPLLALSGSEVSRKLSRTDGDLSATHIPGTGPFSTMKAAGRPTPHLPSVLLR